MLGLNLQLPLVIAIIGNTCILLIQFVLVLGTPNHYKHGVNLKVDMSIVCPKLKPSTSRCKFNPLFKNVCFTLIFL
jgi:hypothetical protein